MKVENTKSLDFDIESIRIEHIENNLSNHDSIIDLFTRYKQNRYRNNYSPERIKWLLEVGRLQDGVFLLYNNDDLISYFGIDDYKNWSCISRLIILKHFKVPLTSAFVLPELEEFARKRKRYGVFFTFNEENKFMYDRSQANDRLENYEKRELKSLQKHYAFTKSIEVMNQYKKLPSPVLYRETKQYILYKPFVDGACPFSNRDLLGNV